MKALLRFIQKHSNFLLFLVLEAVAVSLIVQGSEFQRSKIVQLNRQISGFIYDRADGLREYLYLRENNREISRENLELRNEIRRLRSKLDTASVISRTRGDYQFEFMPARVIHNSVYKQYNYITLDKGERHGVFSDMGVISESGMVGIVLESSAHFSTVIPVINRDFRLSVKLRSNNYAGILLWEGDSPRYASLNEIPFHVDVLEGDTVLTSGFSAIFPEGITVGVIEEFELDRGNFYDIRIRLSTDFQRLFQVNVIRNYRQTEQRMLENQTR